MRNVTGGKDKLILLIRILLIVAVLELVVAVIAPIITRSMRYYNAKESMRLGDYVSTIKELDNEDMGDYKDAVELLKESRYRWALDLYGKGEYSLALEQLLSLEAYKDADDYIERCLTVQKGERYIEMGKNREAIDVLQTVSTYEASESLIEEARLAMKYERYSKENESDSIAESLDGENKQSLEMKLDGFYGEWHSTGSMGETHLFSQHLKNGREYGVLSISDVRQSPYEYDTTISPDVVVRYYYFDDPKQEYFDVFHKERSFVSDREISYVKTVKAGRDVTIEMACKGEVEGESFCDVDEETMGEMEKELYGGIDGRPMLVNASPLTGVATPYKSVLEDWADWTLSDHAYDGPAPWRNLYDSFVLPKEWHYAIEDLNHNGSPELILLWGKGGNDYTISAIYYLKKRKPVCLYAREMKDSKWVIDSNGTILSSFHNGIWTYSWSVSELSSDDSEFIELESIFWERDYEAEKVTIHKYKNGKQTKMTKSEYNSITEQYHDMSNIKAGLDLIPLFQ